MPFLVGRLSPMPKGCSCLTWEITKELSQGVDSRSKYVNNVIFEFLARFQSFCMFEHSSISKSHQKAFVYLYLSNHIIILSSEGCLLYLSCLSLKHVFWHFFTVLKCHINLPSFFDYVTVRDDQTRLSDGLFLFYRRAGRLMPKMFVKTELGDYVNYGNSSGKNVFGIWEIFGRYITQSNRLKHRGCGKSRFDWRPTARCSMFTSCMSALLS
jgi:hypothetical protein